jgi:hypothetical protein
MPKPSIVILSEAKNLGGERRKYRKTSNPARSFASLKMTFEQAYLAPGEYTGGRFYKKGKIPPAWLFLKRLRFA